MREGTPKNNKLSLGKKRNNTVGQAERKKSLSKNKKRGGERVKETFFFGTHRVKTNCRIEFPWSVGGAFQNRNQRKTTLNIANKVRRRVLQKEKADQALGNPVPKAKHLNNAGERSKGGRRGGNLKKGSRGRPKTLFI